MKKLRLYGVLLTAFLVGLVPVQASTPPTEHTFSVTVNRIPVRQLLMIFYDHCEHSGLVFEPNLGELRERLSVKTPLVTCAEFKKVLSGLLQSVGLMVRPGPSVDVIARLPEEEEGLEWKEFIYSPRFRDPAELGVLLSSFVTEGRFAEVDDKTSGDKKPKSLDKLVFFGPEREIETLKSLLHRFDVVVPQVEIAAAIYEFKAGPKESSAIAAALNLFSGRFDIKLNETSNSGTVLKVNLPGFNGALDFLDQDERFSYVAQPRILAKNSEEVTFVAGRDVRVTDSVTTNGAGQSIQSKKTLTAGITLRATPYIRNDIIELELLQSVSNFIDPKHTDPSVMRRELKTRLVVEPGQTYIIGGLKINRKTSSQQTFFGIPLSDSSDAEESEVILLLTVRPESFTETP